MAVVARTSRHVFCGGKPRRTRIALTRSERPSERQRSPAPKRGDWCIGSYGSAPQGAVHLSYFLRDQLYPGIKNKNGCGGFYLCLSHLGINDCQVRPLWAGRQSIRLSAGGGREKLNVISKNSFGFEGNKDPISHIPVFAPKNYTGTKYPPNQQNLGQK